jgi:hypothetical protein
VVYVGAVVGKRAACRPSTHATTMMATAAALHTVEIDRVDEVLFDIIYSNLPKYSKNY